MTAKEFATALNEAGFAELGVEVSTFDVNNAAKPKAPFSSTARRLQSRSDR